MVVLLSGTHAGLEASDWILRWLPLLQAGARVLDVACGSGRHFRVMAQRGLCVTGVDRDEAAVAPLRALGEVIVAELESGPWPLQGREFDAVVVTHYLWRPLLPALVRAVAPGGMLLYETFCKGHERLGRPTRADFLLEPGELLRLCEGLQVVAYEDGLLQQPARRVQRLCALRSAVPGEAVSVPLHPA